jgi:hypothetical protein
VAVSFAGFDVARWQWAARTLTHLYLHTHGAAQENPCMSETESQFKGIRGFLWLAVGFLLLAAAIGSAIYIVVHLLKYL